MDDLAEKLGGKSTYTKPGKPDSEGLITDLRGNPSYSAFESRLRKNDWSPIWFNMSPEHFNGEDWKRQGKYGNWYHITVYGQKYRYGGHMLTKKCLPPRKITIHCDEANPQNPFHER